MKIVVSNINKKKKDYEILWEIIAAKFERRNSNVSDHSLRKETKRSKDTRGEKFYPPNSLESKEIV